MNNSILFILFSIFLLYAEDTGNINGFVFDNENGEALIGANVYIENSLFGTTSNLNGYYILPDSPAGDHRLVCEYIGYSKFIKNVKIKAGENLNIKIVLKPSLFEADEIVVVADSLRMSQKLFNKPISEISLSPKEIKQIPQIIESDLLRTLQSLPGILPVSDYSSELYVRGGTPDQNLILIDGADVYNPEHAFGLFSTFNIDAIKDVEISKGGFKAPYGGRLSSLINVSLLDGNRKEFEGLVGISLLSAKATVQTPIGQFGSLSASFRRTYFDQTYGRFMDDIPDYYFYDGHIKAFFDINANNKLSVSTYWGRDVLDYVFNEDEEDSENLIYNWGNKTGSIRWTHIFNPKLFSNFWLTYSQFSSEFALADFTEDNNITDLTLKGQFEYAMTKSLMAEFGYEYKRLSYAYEEDFPGGIVDINRDRIHYVGYVSLGWQPTDRWKIDSGIRYNYFDSNVDFKNWAPRFSAKYRLTENSNLKLAIGRFHQYLHRVPRAFIADIWTTADENYTNSSANHYILGYQREIAGNIALEVEGYYKQYENIYSLKDFIVDFQPQDYDDEGNPIYTSTNGLFNRGDGNSIGFEVLLRKNYGPLTGWLAYALSRTKYSIDNIDEGKPFTPRHDRTSVINGIANIELKNLIRDILNRKHKKDRGNWLIGFSFIYSTGQPITLTSSTYSMSSFPDWDYDAYLLYPSDKNEFRLPPYIRLDMSINYERQYDNWMVIPYFQFFNLGDRKNVWFLNYENEEEIEGNGQTVIKQDIEIIEMLPFLPTLGVTVKF
ncbi:MAG: TonB-dependent receptor [Calditrichaceae bacterium]